MLPPVELVDFLKKEDHYLIVSHLNPDGDTLGSAAALALALEAMGKKTLLLCRDRVPEQYAFLPGSTRYRTFDEAFSSDIPLSTFRNLVLVDCNEIKRTGMERSPLSSLSFQYSVVIDHHETEKTFGDFRWVVPEVAATGMMVHSLIRALGVSLTKEMAINLYAALVVDTGNFRYENTTPEVLAVASDLAKAGAPPHVIHREINETWSEARFKLYLKVLNTLQMDDGIAVTVVTQKMFEETGACPDDTETFVSVPKVMKDIKVSILLREVDRSEYKVSLRSRDNINVARIAEAFNGGGHKNAAGCTVKMDLGAARAELIRRVKEQIALCYPCPVETLRG
ncbi:MAG: bifunctional oligoribonuclease/PAP phosphatase NrnA [Alphaproteobacteria bacterium]|uniref:Bifunctional oligoribonuclease/PAP phosphatase NrnA n=1 Tax=Candidatus Nitrobium versatile TaxID=2884831 RepID=A0A953J9E8_9BACT|nr:bifunctional oligoribonuclease/PAP phosphatase NrnA [Candidatus Nitrobium versatile]